MSGAGGRINPFRHGLRSTIVEPMMKLAVVIGVCAGLLGAQNLEIAGRVTDPQGRPMAGVAVHLLVHQGAGRDEVAQGPPAVRVNIASRG
jgi:hypothetical protein